MKTRNKKPNKPMSKNNNKNNRTRIPSILKCKLDF